MQIQFYDVSESQELAHLNGQLMTFRELYHYHQTYRASWPTLTIDCEKLCALDFHPYGSGSAGWRRWSTYFCTALQLITGHLPSKGELQIAKGFVMGMPQHFKEQHVDHRFVMCFLPYLFAGFKIHRKPCFVAESNSMMDVYPFVERLFNAQRVLFTSFLCSHRDPIVGDGVNLLQSYIPPQKVRRASSLVLALAHNAHDGIHGELIFMQQGVSAYATSSIFPEVTLAYLEAGRAYEMIDRLRYQYELVGQSIGGIPSPRVKAKLVTLDVLTWRLERFMRLRFGSNWRQQDFILAEKGYDPLVELGVKTVLPGIRRMMPFFSGGIRQKFLEQEHEILERNRITALEMGGMQLAVQAEKIVRWFMGQCSMSIAAKAVYEAAFYYLWGNYCGRSDNVFAIGFDRDHDMYQYQSWKLGAESVKMYRSSKHQQAPLYARRNPNGREHGALTDLSFRQFWR